MKKDSLTCYASAILALTQPLSATAVTQERERPSSVTSTSSSRKSALRKFIAESNYHPQTFGLHTETQLWKNKALSAIAANYNAEIVGSDYEVVTDKAGQSIIASAESQTVKIRLDSGLEMYLISDQAASESSVALSIEAGSWDNPTEFPGMAHFVEHLVFLGNRAFPNESEYFKFLNERKGEFNAYTFHDKTVFGFTIDSTHIDEGLDRFSHLFIDPLFTPSCIEREMHAVSHEFEDNVENEFLRLWRVLKATGNAEHPNAVFSCGNLESLHSITQSDIRKWFDAHYVPQNMHVVMRSPLPIEQMTELALKHFSEIPDRPINERSGFSSPITSEKQQGHFIHITPSSQGRSLVLGWEVPKEFASQYGKRALELVEMALDYDGPNSLANFLEEERLITDFSIDQLRIEKDHALFFISMDLTKKGGKEVDRVISLCFQALNRLKQEQISSSLFDQLTEIEQIVNKRSSSVYPFDFIMQTAGEMIDEELETFPNRTNVATFDPEFVCKFANSLTPQSCIFFFIVDPEEAGVKPNAIEKWMHSPYVSRKIPEEKMMQWELAPVHPSILINSPEEELEIEEVIEDESLLDLQDMMKEGSSVIVDSKLAQISFKMNEDPFSDTVNFSLHLSSPLQNSSVKNVILSMALAGAFQDASDKAFAKGESEDISASFNLDVDDALWMVLKVHKSSVEESLEKIISVLKNATLDEATFHEFTQMFADHDSGDPSPLQYALQILENQLDPSSYLPGDIFNAAASLTYNDFVLFSRDFLKQVFVDGSIYGPIAGETAISYWSKIESTLGADPYDRDGADDVEGFSVASLSEPMFIEKQTDRKGNALVLVLDTGPVTNKSIAAQKVLSSILDHEFFKELRTQQQTAYMLSSWLDIPEDDQTQIFAIQSSTHHPRDLLERTEEFLDKFVAHFEQRVPIQRVEVIRDTLIRSLEKRKAQFDDTTTTSWVDIAIENLRSLTYQEVVEMAKGYLTSDNEKRLAILVAGAPSTTE